MDRAQILLVGLPLFLFCSDIINLFASSPPPRPPKPHHHHHHHHHDDNHRSQPQPVVQQTLDFPTQKSIGIGAIGVGNTVNINFCSSCSYRGNAVTMKNMLETAFPGISVNLAKLPPSSPKTPTEQSCTCGSIWSNRYRDGCSGAFEVYCNGELVFSKLKNQRFPGEIELKDLVGRKIAEPRIVNEALWS
ncbi:selenoprotein, Rdx type [Actinidia rufa]|uniref:Selenoprotein, Rdx type n=1 Tax=Actinidia rufa TaxID=165716 RepID=A0A7J0E7K3_9ERIC|nr:selenoprotein, Rdx type [Actinidia rufa]